MRRVCISKKRFEKLLADGYGAVAIACALGVSRETLRTWTKNQYGKTVLDLRKDIKGVNYEQTKN